MRPAFPESIENYGPVIPFDGRNASVMTTAIAARRVHVAQHGRIKRLRSIAHALDACELKDGAVLSFHHHLRNGDGVLIMMVQAAARRGLKELTIAASSIFPVHAPLVQPIEALQAAAARSAGPALARSVGGRVVAVAEYRDGSVIDLIHEVGVASPVPSTILR